MNKLISVFRRLLKIDRNPDQEAETPGNPPQTAAVPGRNEARELHQGKRRVKENYTSHWDLDYLPREELEKIMAESERKPSSEESK